jgi:hypothetical protein
MKIKINISHISILRYAIQTLENIQILEKKNMTTK